MAPEFGNFASATWLTVGHITAFALYVTDATDPPGAEFQPALGPSKVTLPVTVGLPLKVSIPFDATVPVTEGLPFAIPTVSTTWAAKSVAPDVLPAVLLALIRTVRDADPTVPVENMQKGVVDLS